jgi:hypothetical protein
VTQEIKMAGLLLLVLGLTACRKTSQPPKAEESQPPAPATASYSVPATETPVITAPPANGRGVKTEIRNVMFHLTDRAAAHVETLSGEMWPTGKNDMPIFDDKLSFEVRVAGGRISITPQAMAELLNAHVFAKNDSPFKDISISIDKDRLRIKGKLHTKGDIPFETTATLSAAPDGRIRVTAEKLKALHVPMKGMMDKLGIDLAQLVSTSKIPGMVTDKNDLLMDLGVLLPPPHIKGRVSRVLVENNSIVTLFGEAAATAAANDAASYMSFQGNRLRLGKLTMDNADLTVLNLDSGDPIDWSQDHYREQLVAGYSQMTATFGLRTYVKDFAKLQHSAGGSGRSPSNKAVSGNRLSGIEMEKPNLG